MLRKRNGFTLIELLVVIAIIAILAAILFPVFARARTQARKAACLSNCKQLGLATMMYCDDYDGGFPRFNIYWNYAPNGTVGETENGDWGNDLTMYWWNHLTPYVKNFDLFACPQRRTDGLTVPTWMSSTGTMKHAVGYAMNYELNGYDGGTGPYLPTQASQSSIPSVADKLLLCDAPGSLGIYHVWSFYVLWLPGVSKQHGGMINAVYCDGHAKSTKVKGLITPRLAWNVRDQYPFEAGVPNSGFSSIVNSEQEAQTYLVGLLDSYEKAWFGYEPND